MHNKSVATEESLRFTLRDLASPILRRKRTASVTFLLVVSVTLLLGDTRFQKYQPHWAILAQAAPKDAKGASNTIVGTPGGQSLTEADLNREAKRDEQIYLQYLSAREQKHAEDTLIPAQSTTVIVLIAIVLGLFVSLSLTYLVDYCDPCFHTPVQVMRTLRTPLVVAMPKRTP